MTEELKRRINNIVQIGTITEVKSAEGLALARVNILERVTDFLPVFLWANDFVKVWMPIRVGQQVAVLAPFGNGNGGLILPSIYNKGCKEPNGANDENVVIEFAKGVRIESDGKNININAPKDINVTCDNANVNCTTTNITCDTSTITSKTINNGDVTINGNLLLNGNLTMAGGSSGSGKAKLNGDLEVSGVISDVKGDLTNHTHDTTDGATAEAR